MNIGNLNGSNGVDRSGDRPSRTDGKKPVDAGSSGVQDRASISDQSRETATAIESLSRRAQQPGEERKDKVAAAMERLMNGQLDTPEVHRAAAERMLGSDFLA